MVACFDHRVVVGDDHLLVANDRANGGAGRQANLLDGLADDLARLRITVGNRLDGLCRTAAQ
ncbi:hypothetical protein D3C81_2306730 [compost metagenome]